VTANPPTAAPVRRRVHDPLRLEDSINAHVEQEQARIRQAEQRWRRELGEFQECARPAVPDIARYVATVSDCRVEVPPRTYTASRNGRMIGGNSVAAFQQRPPIEMRGI
jgi:hypothetical protein